MASFYTRIRHQHGLHPTVVGDLVSVGGGALTSSLTDETITKQGS